MQLHALARGEPHETGRIERTRYLHLGQAEDLAVEATDVRLPAFGVRSRDVLQLHWLPPVRQGSLLLGAIHEEVRTMGRPVTLFTGQWADLPLEELAAKARAWGFDGLELATWGDHFEVDRALADA